jgi:tetratricopeptide (TPR) repeat protein
LSTLPPPPPSANIDGLEVEAQKFNNCGPANMTIVLNFHGVDIDQVEAAEYLKPNVQDRNVSPWQMVDYVNDQIPDMRAAAFGGGSLALLKQLVANGFPVIIEKGYDPGRDEGWYGHYLTVHSYDDEGRIFLSKDTYLGPFDGGSRMDSYTDILAAWQQFNYTFIVIYRPADEARVNRVLGPEMLDPLRMWDNAARLAQAETEKDPGDEFAWFNLGTSLTRLGEATGDRTYYEQGAAAFDRALSIGVPGRMLWYQFRIFIAYMKLGRYQDMVDLVDGMFNSGDERVRGGARYVEELYLYKGHAQAYLGDIAGARSSYQLGLDLNPNSYPIQWALNSLP